MSNFITVEQLKSVIDQCKAFSRDLSELDTPGIDLESVTRKLHERLMNLVREADTLQIINQNLMFENGSGIGETIEIDPCRSEPCLKTFFNEKGKSIHIEFNAPLIRAHFGEISNHISNMATSILTSSGKHASEREVPARLQTPYNQTAWLPATIEAPA